MARRPHSGPPLRRTTITLTEETWAVLDKESRDSGRSLSEVAEWCILRGVETGVPIPKSDLILYRDKVLAR